MFFKFLYFCFQDLLERKIVNSSFFKNLVVFASLEVVAILCNETDSMVVLAEVHELILGRLSLNALLAQDLN